MENQKNTLPDFSTPTTKILAIGRWTEKGLIAENRLPVMPKEVPATLSLYLTGVMDAWYVKPDLSGVVFIINTSEVNTAHELLEKLPLGQAGLMEFDYIPLGPLSPLRFLLPKETAA
ncbi:hypothetical protein AAFN85_01890 [Mucilaginibacter sp. CAU 1740]|uniref:hypothetical protein n=1 Tax=Mucilaginibacter sp. CAU 1740 TaxID=3140365 RepID=UPI00325B1C5C